MHMKELEIDAHSRSDVTRLIEEVAAELGLVATMRSTLKQYPGSTHWHFKKLVPNRRGLAQLAQSVGTCPMSAFRLKTDNRKLKTSTVPVPFSAAGLETASKRGKQRGVLEATYWPRENRAWLSYRSGRDADWIPDAIRQFQRLVEKRLPGRST